MIASLDFLTRSHWPTRVFGLHSQNTTNEVEKSIGRPSRLWLLWVDNKHVLNEDNSPRRKQ